MQSLLLKALYYVVFIAIYLRTCRLIVSPTFTRLRYSAYRQTQKKARRRQINFNIPERKLGMPDKRTFLLFTADRGRYKISDLFQNSVAKRRLMCYSH